MPGAKMTHGVRRKYTRPSAMMLPHDGISGGIPAPRKPRMASSSMAEAQIYVACTMSGGMVLGSTWRDRIHGKRVPAAIAAST